jgi:hypothetical protein
MLKQVLKEIEAAGGTISLDALGQRLGLDRSTLEGMIQFWVRKGRLKEDNFFSSGTGNCVTGSCGGSCSGPQGCPFTMRMPRTYSLAFYEPRQP